MKHVNAVKQILNSEGINIEVLPQMVPGNTGSFEVILDNNGKETLLHSKLAGNGFITQTNKQQFLDVLKSNL